MNSVWATGIVAVLVCAVGAKNISGTQESPRVIYGKDGDIKNTPYQVSLQFKNGDTFNHFCGGTILSPKVILTAAHCDDPIRDGQIKQSDVRIRAGSTQRTSGGQVVAVEKIIVNENYDRRKLQNDIALIILAEELQMSDSVKAAQLPEEGQDLPVNSTATISGWGFRDGSRNQPNTLQVGQTYIISNEDCQKRLGGFKILDSVVCGVRGPNNLALTCAGDSGGPLAKDNVVYGAVSFGNNRRCARKSLTAFTRVSSFLQFIKEKGNL